MWPAGGSKQRAADTDHCVCCPTATRLLDLYGIGSDSKEKIVIALNENLEALSPSGGSFQCQYRIS